MDWGWDDLIGIMMVLGLGGGLITFAVASLLSRAATRRAGVTTNAEVLTVGLTQYGVRYEVRYASGDTEYVRWVAVPDVVRGVRAEVGDLIQVLVHPNKPWRALLPRTAYATKVDLALWGAIGLATLMVVVIAVQVIASRS